VKLTVFPKKRGYEQDSRTLGRWLTQNVQLFAGDSEINRIHPILRFKTLSGQVFLDDVLNLMENYRQILPTK